MNDESERWRHEAEVLVGDLLRVTSQRDRLQIRLADNEHLLADAMAYIDELEGLVKAMDAELWRLRRAKPDRHKFAALAGAAGLVLGSIIGGVGEGIGQDLYRDLRNIKDRTDVVVMHCDGTFDLEAERHRNEPDPPEARTEPQDHEASNGRNRPVGLTTEHGDDIVTETDNRVLEGTPSRAEAGEPTFTDDRDAPGPRGGYGTEAYGTGTYGNVDLKVHDAAAGGESHSSSGAKATTGTVVTPETAEMRAEAQLPQVRTSSDAAAANDTGGVNAVLAEPAPATDGDPVGITDSLDVETNGEPEPREPDEDDSRDC